ncbi:MAG: GntR family transcriptional regulator [Phycisphaeraceae bacterium]|nr:GntR family transcriptional regulator [Phycisphaeraceae bacterium]
MVTVGNKVSLSQQVAHRLKQQVRQGIYQPGSTLPSVRKLCSDFGVSTTVICRAIRGLEEEGIVQTHHGKGTIVQQVSHAARTAILFAFIQPYPANMIFEQQVLQYAEQGFSARDNFMVVRSSQLDVALEKDIVEHAVNNGVQGILLWPVENNPNGPYFEKLSKKLPIVLVDRLLDNAQLPAVIFDTYEAGREICRTLLAAKKRKRILCLIDNLHISPYQNLMQGLRDEAKDLGRNEDMTLVQISISEFISHLNQCDFSMVDHFKEDIQKLINEGGYDTIFCPQEEFLDYVMVQTGLYEKLDNFQLAAITGPGANARTRQYNESGVLKWVTDFPEMISKAADMLQRSVLTGNRANEIVTLKIKPSPL